MGPLLRLKWKIAYNHVMENNKIQIAIKLILIKVGCHHKMLKQYWLKIQVNLSYTSRKTWITPKGQLLLRLLFLDMKILELWLL